MQGINCVKGEIHNVLTVLRLNQRSHTNNHTGNYDENILIRGFYDLYDNLCQHSTLDNYNVTEYLAPFLSVIISNDPVYVDLFAKSTALNAIQKFLVYGLIHKQCINVDKAVSNICVSVIHCRLDYNNLYSIDDVESVHMKLLEILCETLKLPVGEYLTDNIVCDMVYAAYNVRTTSKLNYTKSFQSSVLMQRYAENILSQMILVLFARLSPESHSQTTEILPVHNTAQHTTTQQHTNKKYTTIESILRNTDDDIDPTTQLYKPYGITALHRILRFLSALINPADTNNTDSDRVLGLRLIRTVLETAGHRIGAFDILVQTIQNELCKYLLQSTNTTDLHVLSLTLRIVYDLFQTVKQHLKVQLEVFFTSIHLRIGESMRSTYEQKELVIESLVEFCNEPSLIVGLYRNYDCEVGCTDLYSDLCTFLAKYALPQNNAIPNQLNLLSLEALIAVLSSINTRFCNRNTPADTRKQSIISTVTSPTNTSQIQLPSTISRTTSNQSQISLLDTEHTPHRDELSTNRANKQKLVLAAQSFNKDGIKSLPTLQTLGVLPTHNMTARDVVQFIRTTPNLELKIIGELFGSTNQFALDILKEYCQTFDFSAYTHNNNTAELAIDNALRYFLSTFLLPGEAQIIDRILEQFAIAYYKYAPGPLKSADATHVLAYSVIMLNTDAHNSQVQRKMTKQEFIRNTRGINEGTDLPQEYLSELYDRIVSNEIKLKHDSTEPDELNFDQLTNGNKRLTGIFQTTTARIHGKNMFLIIWQISLNVIITYIDTQSYSSSQHTMSTEWYEYDNKLINKLTHACNCYASISAYYTLYQQLNTLIISLTRTMTTFIESDITVAETHNIKPIVLYGYDKRLQVIVQILFQIVSKYGLYHLIESYTNIISCILYLQSVNVLHNTFTVHQLTDYNGDVVSVNDTTHIHTEQCTHDTEHTHNNATKQNGTSGGLFSWGLSIFGSNDTKPSAHVLYETGTTDETYIQRAYDAIEQAHINDIFTVQHDHSMQSVVALCNALLLATDVNNASTVYNKTLITSQSILVCINALFHMLLTACNNNHIDAVKHLSQVLQAYIDNTITASGNIALIERLLLNINTLAVSIDDKAHTVMIVHMLLSFNKLSIAAIDTLSTRIIATVQSVLKQCALYIDSTDTITHLIQLITQYKSNTQCMYLSYQSFVSLIDTCCTSITFQPIHTAIQLYLQPIDNNSVKIKQVFDALYKLHNKLDKLQTPVITTHNTTINATQAIDSVKHKGLQREKQRCDLWLLSLSTLCKYSADKRYDIRQHGVQCLYDALLESHVTIIHPTVWQSMYQHILLPLLSNIIKLQPDTNDKQAIDIRVQIVTIIYRTLQTHIDILVKLQDFTAFWLTILQSTVACITIIESNNTSANTVLINHILDTLKSTILILYTTNIFDTVNQRSSTDIFTATIQTLNKLSNTIRDILYSQLQANGFDTNRTYAAPKPINGHTNNGFVRPVKY